MFNDNMRAGVFLQDQNRHVRFYLSMHIRQKREVLGLSTKEMAARLDVSELTYKRLESGRVRLNEVFFEQIVEILQLREDDLIEISKIANIAYANAISKELSPHYPL